jgi:hypothetical protein
MERRLYFLIPDRIQALAVVDDLVRHGINIDHMHAIGDRHTRMDGLPAAPGRGSGARTSRLRTLTWKANTLCFAVAAVATVLAPVFVGLSWWLLTPVVVMTVNFLIGLYLNNTCNRELSVFRDVVAHGEILLLVDVPEPRASEVETEIQRQHPESASSLHPDPNARAMGL